ncbi:uncharacterized protein LOC110178080 [Drosophila serrata]|uniref:uncharacterized protein LOC110178080 n=1 Tax=Drosophila serrata TaxID=7274 RepID=UPI000A1CFD61|nr:uncharacterized protein LOC110178080 [Drosophila serrata]
MEPADNTFSKRKFILVTLLIWLLFVLIAIPQWMIICLYSKNPLLFTLILLLAGFILLACIHLFEAMRYRRPWNIIFVLICYELLTIGVALFLSKWNLLHTLILIGAGILISGLVLLVSYLLIINRLYPNPTKVAVLACLGFILVFCIRSIDLFTNWFFIRDVEVSLFLASVFVVMICHILITNDNFDLLRQDDVMHVAFVLQICFMLLMIACRVAAFCVKENIEYFDSRSKTTRYYTIDTNTTRREDDF